MIGIYPKSITQCVVFNGFRGILSRAITTESVPTKQIPDQPIPSPPPPPPSSTDQVKPLTKTTRTRTRAKTPESASNRIKIHQSTTSRTIPNYKFRPRTRLYQESVTTRTKQPFFARSRVHPSTKSHVHPRQNTTSLHGPEVIKSIEKITLRIDSTYTKLMYELGSPTPSSDQTDLIFKVLEATVTRDEFVTMIKVIQDTLAAEPRWLRILHAYLIDESNLSTRYRIFCEENSKNYYLTKAYLLAYRYNTKIYNILDLNANWLEYCNKTEVNLLVFDYLTTYLLNLINTKQFTLASQDYDQLFQEYLSKGHTEAELLEKLPTVAILQNCINQLDFQRIETILEKAITNNFAIPGNIWLNTLEISLQYTNYPCVKLVYKHFIMKEFPDGRIMPETIILGDKFSDLFNSLTDRLISQILHVFSINGDIESTLSVIESHYVHKKVQGSRAITNELLCKVIEAYCYQRETTIPDESIMKIMTLIDDAVSRSTKGEVIRYNDITQAINVKLMNYNVHDRNIERYNREIQHRFEYYRSKVQESEETDPNNLLMVKKSNKNIYTAKQGVVLLNMSTLDEFVNLHMKYALDSKFHKYTRTFFINCLFAHLMTFGNFTALVNAMNGLSRVSRDWKGDLDYDSFKIIFTAMGNSESSKRCAYEFFTYFKRYSKKISRGYYIGMIKAASYGYVDYGVQFYIYHYLKDFGNLSESIIRLLPKIETMEQLVEFCSSRDKLTPEEIENYWATNNLNNSPDKLFREEENTNPQRYIPRYDERDVELLQKLLT